MSKIREAIEAMLEREGGYDLHKVSGDTGGWTFAGVARNYWPQWEGWLLIDKGDTSSEELKCMVDKFYQVNFWGPVKGDEIKDDKVASSIFDLAVNSGVKTSVRLAQSSVGALTDGVIGPKTLEALNSADATLFHLRFALHKVDRYNDIARNNTQLKFLRGWINRTLSQVEYKP